MRRLRLSLALGASALAVSAVGAAPALAGPEKNPHAQTITLTCPFGQVTGTAAAGPALLLEGGGVAVLQGATTAAGEELVPINPGLLGSGTLVQCSYFSERRQEQVIAYVLFVP